MHRAIHSALLLVLVLSAAPGAARAAPDMKTKAWEQLVVPMLRETFCKKKGTMVELFKIAPRACVKTYDYAVRHCLKALQVIPYYAVSDKSSGESWGRILGSCIGVAYDMKHGYHKAIP